MGQHQRLSYAAFKDAQIKLSKEVGVCKRHGAKAKRCNIEGCTNHAIKGGVCIRHGAKLKRCSSEGCTNQAVKGGVCRRHGANRNSADESTAFVSYLGSEFEKTTVTPPNQCIPATSMNNGNLPEEVVVCGVVTEHYEEV
jgi:hypothetical protein